MSFTCPKCGMTSHHPKDAEHGYCGHCHEYTGRRPSASFHDIGAEQFPVTFRAFNVFDVEVWTETVTEPGALYIPPLINEFGPVVIRVEFGDGTFYDPRL